MKQLAFLSLTICLGVFGAAEESLVIGPARRDEKTVRALTAQERKAKMFEEAREASALFAPTSFVVDSMKRAAIAPMLKEKSAYIEMFRACMMPQNVPEPAQRIGAMLAVCELQPADMNLSYSLGSAAVSDPVAEVRAAAVGVIKARKDDFAIRTMIGHLFSTYDANGKVLDQNAHAQDLEAFKALADKRVVQAILYYVTMELRLSNIDGGSLTTRQIDSYQVNNNSALNLAFPIQTPELKMTKVKTSVVAPAINALQDLTGQTFGQNTEKWQRWVEKQK